MQTYVLLSKLTPEGRKTVKDRPQRITEVNKEVEGYGGRVVSQFAVLGAYDFVTILEAPNNETVARISSELGSRGTIELMSMPAFSVEELTKGLTKSK